MVINSVNIRIKDYVWAQLKIMKNISIIFGAAGILLYVCYLISENDRADDLKPEFLFEKDGCKMYRFNDKGRTVYWSDCSGKSEYKEWRGKVKIQQQSITTK